MRALTGCALLCLLALLVACDGGGGTAPDVATGTDTVATPEVEAALPDLTGRIYLFSTLATYAPTDLFNSTWDKDLAGHDIVIMLRVHAHDRVTGALSMSVVTGAATLDPGTGAVLSYHPALDGTLLEVTLSGGAFELEETFELDIMTQYLSFPLHLVDLTGHGEILPDGSGLRDGYFVGGLLEADMKTQCMGVAGLGAVNLQWFLTTGNLCPDRDTDGDGAADAYTFDWHFDAVEITGLYDDTPIEVLTSVTDCVPHDEGCAD